MRYVDLAWRRCALLSLAAALGGCATVTDTYTSIRDTVAPAAAPVPAAVDAKSALPAATVEAPVSLAVQRAFDDAARALRAGRSADAERGFRALVQSNPELGGPHANLGIIQRQAGKLAESATELEQAVRLGPKQPTYFNQLGITYRRQGRFDQAREAYEKAIALDPAYAAPYLNLGILHDLYFGDSRRALELYDRYLALSPAGDATVTKWVAELKNRKPDVKTASSKEK